MKDAATIPLAPPTAAEGEVLTSVLMKRRSVREFEAGELSLQAVARLLWAGQGVSHSSGKRTAPSAHALYPLSLHLVAGSIESLDPGLYTYDPRSHSLEAKGHGDLRGELWRACLEDQTWVRDCAGLIAITGDIEAATRAFAHQPPRGQRGVRYIYMEAGTASQNIALEAVYLGIGSVLVAGFDDERVGACLGLETVPLILMPLGVLPQ